MKLYGNNHWDCGSPDHGGYQTEQCVLYQRDYLLAAIEEHHSQKADDRCIDDDDKLYAAAGLPPCDRRVGDKFEMLKNCARFIDRRCEGGGWPTYAALEARVKAMTGHVIDLATALGEAISVVRSTEIRAQSHHRLSRWQHVLAAVGLSEQTGIALIAIERQRQIDVEGFGPEHDDQHTDGSLAMAAAYYAGIAAGMAQEDAQDMWPWADEYRKPSPDPIRNSVKAATLLAAEIDRQLRLRDKKEKAKERYKPPNATASQSQAPRPDGH